MNVARGRWLAVTIALQIAMGSTGRAGAADEDWRAVVALDAGPRVQPENREAAAQMVFGHLAKQEKALRGFLIEHPSDARSFEARLRLARLLQIRADLENSDKPRAESKRLLDELEKTATPEQRPELEFAKVARLMRGLRPTDAAQRDAVLRAARQFQAAYPADRRVAALLVEVATLFDAQPKTKEVLLEDARAVASDEELKARIADDLKRVRLLGEEVTLRFTSLQGEEITLEAFRSRPVFILFFATISPPAVAAVAKLQQELATLPKGAARVIGISLDENREAATTFLKTRAISWPVACDGKGWQSSLARDFGINAVPTLWLLDAQGKLRSLNALQSPAAQVRHLLQER